MKIIQKKKKKKKNRDACALRPISCHWSLLMPPENRKTKGSLMFLRGIKKDQWHEMG